MVKCKKLKVRGLFTGILVIFLGSFLVAQEYATAAKQIVFHSEYEATSFDENGQVMSLRHKVYDVKGVQYHPESVLTPQGKKILENWINS